MPKDERKPKTLHLATARRTFFPYFFCLYLQGTNPSFTKLQHNNLTLFPLFCILLPPSVFFLSFDATMDFSLNFNIPPQADTHINSLPRWFNQVLEPSNCKRICKSICYLLCWRNPYGLYYSCQALVSYNVAIQLYMFSLIMKDKIFC